MEKIKRRGRWFRRLLRILGVLIFSLILACFIFDYYVQFRKSDEELNKIFSDNHIPATIKYYETHGRKLRYVSVGNDSLPTVLFLHGSPGSMSYYSWRFKDSSMQNRFKIYAVDRPGYGYSGFGDPEPSIQMQSEMIRPILDSLNKAKHPIIVVGGSYGSSIACRLAMDHPELVDGLVLTGPSLAPGQETYFWFTNVIENPAIRWFIPRMFRSANTEKVYHKKELEKMLPLWKNIRVPVMYLQGAHDDIVDTSNASFARREMVNVPYLDIHFFPNRAHRLAQYEWTTIRESILKVYSLAQRTSNIP
ncbi:MAG: alpha/beta fold hydrolase [Flavisolibacter sp.]